MRQFLYLHKKAVGKIYVDVQLLMMTPQKNKNKK